MNRKQGRGLLFVYTKNVNMTVKCSVPLQLHDCTIPVVQNDIGELLENVIYQEKISEEDFFAKIGWDFDRLFAFINSDKYDIEIRSNAARLFVKFAVKTGRQEYNPDIERIKKHPRPMMRLAALYAFEELCDENSDACEEIKEFLNDEHNTIVKEARSILENV